MYPSSAMVPNIPTGGIMKIRMIAIISRIKVDFFIVIPPLGHFILDYRWCQV